MKQKDLILQFIDTTTTSQLDSPPIIEIGVNASDVAIDLDINRANVSKELNKLWREGILIKVDGRPTYFTSHSVMNESFPEKFFSSYYSNMTSFLSTLDSEPEPEEAYVETNTLNQEQKQLHLSLSYPLSGFPPLVQFQDGINAYQFVYDVYLMLLSQKLLEKPLQFKYIDCSIPDSSDFHDFFTHHIDPNSSKPSNATFYFIHNTHLLDESKQIQFNRFFINQRWLQSDKSKQHKYVIGMPSSVDPSHINTFSFVISTPPFTDLSMLERLTTIINSFKSHAKQLNKTIKIQRELFKAFCINLIETNYLVIEKDITTALIRSNFRSIQTNRSTCTLLWSDFAFPLIHESFPKHTSLNIIDSFFDETIQFDASGHSKIDYIYNQPIINELNTMILQTDFNNEVSIKRMIESYISRIKRSQNHELHALTIHSGYSKFNLNKIQGNEEEVGFDFLTTQLNTLQIDDFNPDTVQWIKEYYSQVYNQTDEYETGLLLIIDSRHNTETYHKLLSTHRIPSYVLSLRTPITIDELNKTLDHFSINTDIVIITDINIYQNIESLLESVTNRNVISYYPLSIPLIENTVDQIKKKTSIEDLRKEKQRYSVSSFDHITSADDEDNRFLGSLIDKFLSKQLSFLDANKAVSVLYPLLGNILSQLKLSYTKQFVVKFVVHSSFMVERCIKKETLEYSNLNQHIKENDEYYKLIQKEFVPVEEMFGITIPISEIAYIVDIFAQN